ncbi:hypothetical protein ACFO4E_02050 [Nocardiopsis mangrovi]|uniref:Uncharacterized protein n=1 Tax=Nocardiopsis mangrovi TaxID=1179818 RepID=A0ABV9DPP5_9ACTN
MEIAELESRDLGGNRIFSATHEDETRVAKIPADEAPEIRAMWDAQLRAELDRMPESHIHALLMEPPVHGCAGPPA